MTATPIHQTSGPVARAPGDEHLAWSTDVRPALSQADDSGEPADVTTESPAPRRRLPTWTPWFLGRLASGAAAILAISVIVFASTQALPSDPARVILGPDAPEETVRTLRAQLGLDQPVATQYARWVRRAAVGDFGRSLDSHVPVIELIGRRLRNTALLLGGVMTLIVPFALALGVWLAVRRDSRLDRAFVTTLIVLKALPAFAVAMGLIMLLSTSVFELLPAVSLVDPDRPLWGQLSYLVLPTLTLALSTLPYLVRLVRASMIEALETDYVTQARLRGIPERRVLWRHAAPNALVPAIQGLALTLSVLVGGTIVVEVVFAYPGIGSALNAAVGSRDIPMLQGLVLILTTAVVGVNLAADLLTVLLTPRLRTS
jgi:peptide/nickel transport system permease protein